MSTSNRFLKYICFLVPVMAFAAETLQLNEVCTVAPRILSVELRDGQVLNATPVHYQATSSDAQRVWRTHGSRFIERDGAIIGALVGTKGETLMPFDRFAQKPFAPQRLDETTFYRLRSAADPNYSTATEPVAVHRKTRPFDIARTGRWTFKAALSHRIYLEFAQPLKGARTYELSFANEQLPSHTFRHDPFRTVSEAIHVTQLGFHPRDALKQAFLSLWKGSGQGHIYTRHMTFKLIDTATDRAVFVGDVEKRLDAEDADTPALGRNASGTDIYEMDFSSFQTPGRYRVFIDGIGCSPDIAISGSVWRDGFKVAARGLLHQRSGIALHAPPADWPRPQPFHQDQGVSVYHSTCTLMDSGYGLNARGSDHDRFGNLIAGRTTNRVPHAWGGYFDSGDWNRRIQHLDVSRLLLELFEAAPAALATMPLAIPEATNALPDLLDEALWGIDFFRRMQTDAGGIRGGIAMVSHPRYGETSWQNSLPLLAYAPGAWSSHVYAGVAARAARCLMILNHPRASTYLDSAIRAMTFAESAFAQIVASRDVLPPALHDARNLAAAELYRVTGASEWNRLFLASTAFQDAEAATARRGAYDQQHAAFVYARARTHRTHARVVLNARNAIVRDADIALRDTSSTGFGWAQSRSLHRSGYGAFSTPQSLALVRAHILTGDERYIRALVSATQSPLGANPLNVCYTTGIGHRFPENPLVIDARMTQQAAPTGITVYGPLDPIAHRSNWAFDLIQHAVFPPIEHWPVLETYFDVYMFPAMCEFTVFETIAPTVYTLGYLAIAER